MVCGPLGPQGPGPNEILGPYRPPREANLPFVPRPSIWTLREGGAPFRRAEAGTCGGLPPDTCLRVRQARRDVRSGHRARSAARPSRHLVFCHTAHACSWWEACAYSPAVLGSRALPEPETTRRRQMAGGAVPEGLRPRQGRKETAEGACSRRGFLSPGSTDEACRGGPPDLGAGLSSLGPEIQGPTARPRRPRETSGPLRACPPRPLNLGPSPPHTLSGPVWGWGLREEEGRDPSTVAAPRGRGAAASSGRGVCR